MQSAPARDRRVDERARAAEVPLVGGAQLRDDEAGMSRADGSVRQT